MSLHQLLAMRATMPKSLSMDLSPVALNAWNPGLRAETKEADATISIMDVIGYDWWTGEGTTAKRIAGALRSIGAEKDVTVYINSPGGDLFEGLAIHNLLKDHKGKVTVKIIGVAASAASVIAVAGDEVEIARAAFYMVHNSWVVAAGNRHELREVADWLEPFDFAMADLYAERSGKTVKEMQKLMDAESWLPGSQSVELGLADSIIDINTSEGDADAQASALKKMEVALARAGLSRSDRRNLMNEFKTSMPGATGSDMPGAIGKPAGGNASLNLQLGGLTSLAASISNNLNVR